MKKAVSLLLALLAVLTLASCGAGGSDDTVDIVIPASLVTEDASDKLTAEQKQHGIIKAVAQDDGSVTYTFKRSAYETYIAELKQTTANGLDQIIHDEDVTSIKTVSYNDDFSALTFTVDRAAFENSTDGLTCYGAYLAVSVYKAYAQLDDTCTITIVDETTGETLGSVTYPDAMNAAAEKEEQE